MVKVGIIGTGPSGLSAIRHCIKEGLQVVAFEQNDDVGGQWCCTDEFTVNTFGLEPHSSIFSGLTTNLPKELMSFPDFPYNKEIKETFLTPDKVLDYFHRYTNEFDLRKYIMFEHQVIRVCPLPNSDLWEIMVKDLPNNFIKVYQCNFVFICNGLSTPWLPKIKGQSAFKGHVMHSHAYRNSKTFENEKVLVVGGGASALDIVLQLSETAKKIFWVHKIKEKFGREINVNIPERVELKCNGIKCMTLSGAEFNDGSVEEFSTLIYATGFDFSFPFLSVDSGIFVDDKKIYPLYKHCININKPSLGIIGLPFVAAAVPMSDLQVRFCLEYWTDRKALPLKEEMLEETNKHIETLKSKGYGNHKTHFLGPIKNCEYYAELAETAGIEPLKPVMGAVFDCCLEKIFSNYCTFRHFKYTFINDTEFICEALK